MMKNKIISILSNETDPSIRFEVLENFLEYIDSQSDVIFLMELLRQDPDPCVRHKAAAQLFRIEEKQLTISLDIKSEIIKALIDRAFNDESTVVRHESIEALGYLMDKTALKKLEILKTDKNLDVQSTAIISLATAKRRIENNLNANDVGKFLIGDADLPI